MKNEVKPLYLVIIGIILIAMWWIVGGMVGALFNVAGLIILLIGLVNGIIKAFKDSSAKDDSGEKKHSNFKLTK